MSAAYYNEIDPYAAEWLRNLIARGLIAPGDVDERDIRDVMPSDLTGYTQCHFFAGIGGWSLALRIAGWPDDHPVHTGSCPCQPFSAAGKQHGERDERHLWPEFRRLIEECGPPVVFGEQVASRLGRRWLAGVRADLEALGYGVGAADLCAAGVGAPHIRQRLWWVGERPDDAASARRHAAWAEPEGEARDEARGRRPERGRADGGWLEYADRSGPQPGESAAAGPRHWSPLVATSSHRGLAHGEGDGRRKGGADAPGCDEGTGAQGTGCRPADNRGGGSRGVGHAIIAGLEGHAGNGDDGNQPGWFGAPATGPVAGTGRADPWSGSAWIPCADGKARRIEPGIEPLAHGVPTRVGRLRAYGNAIVPEVAAGFILAYRPGSRRIA